MNRILRASAALSISCAACAAWAAPPPGQVVRYDYSGAPTFFTEHFGWGPGLDNWISLGVTEGTTGNALSASFWFRDYLPPDTTTVVDPYHPSADLIGVTVRGAPYSYGMSWFYPGTELYRISLGGTLRTDGDGSIATWSIYGNEGSPNHSVSGSSDWSGSGGSDRIESEVFDWVQQRTWNADTPGTWTISVVDSPVPLPGVPEPASAALLAAGLGIVGVAARRRAAARGG